MVCPLDAEGTHYGVKTCGGCNFFFRRSIQTKTHYICIYANSEKCNKCVIGSDFPKCKHCRFQKCLKVGMQKDMIGKRKSRIKGAFILVKIAFKDFVNRFIKISKIILISIVNAPCHATVC